MMTKKDWDNLCRKAMSGNPEAEWELGARYDEGVNDSKDDFFIKQDAVKAVHWYKRSAEHNNSSAQLCLGYCFDTGRGIQQNKKKAIFWYKKALKNGESSAANNIATVYRDLHNNRRAFFWYKRAAEAQDDDALVEIGSMYYNGIGVRRNYQLAIESFKKAIDSDFITEAGREDAKYYLGLAFYEGKGVNKSIAKAVKWFKNANIDNDHDRAKAALYPQLSDIEY